MGCIFSHSSTTYNTQERATYVVEYQDTINLNADDLPPVKRVPPYKRKILREKRWIDYRLHE